MQIAAALLREPNTPFTIEMLTLAEPRAGEVRVKLAACGVCHSDWHLVAGTTRHPMPVVAGHEGAGVVDAVGDGVTHVQIGDHVVLNWSPACGDCFYCQHGQPNLCDTYTDPIWAGTMLDGTPRLSFKGQPVYHYCGLAAFGEYAVVPAPSCIPIRRDVPLAVASLVGCAVATGVGAVLFTAGVRPGESAVVFGVGGVGLNVVQGLALCGAYPIIAVDTNAHKMALAMQFGATQTIHSDGNAERVLGAIREATGGRGADHSFEAVGLTALQELAFAAARPGGTVVLAGLSPMGSATNLPGAVITRQEKTIKGSYYGSVDARRDFPLLLDLYMGGRLKLDELVSQQWRLDDINEAFAVMLTGDVARGVIVFED
ncbi:MAG: Zn-dependent alcohol dehydrogenase [Chloroflexota bacterium]|nr:Zn-dependent alcohol dehydrogenase [Chloroflexota bacterium]